MKHTKWSKVFHATVYIQNLCFFPTCFCWTPDFLLVHVVCCVDCVYHFSFSPHKIYCFLPRPIVLLVSLSLCLSLCTKFMSKLKSWVFFACLLSEQQQHQEKKRCNEKHTSSNANQPPQHPHKERDSELFLFETEFDFPTKKLQYLTFQSTVPHSSKIMSQLFFFNLEL